VPKADPSAGTHRLRRWERSAGRLPPLSSEGARKRQPHTPTKVSARRRCRRTTTPSFRSRHRSASCSPAMPGSSAKPGSTTLGWRPGGRPFRLLVTADAYPHLRAAVDAGSSSTKVTRSGSGWPAAWTESPPTSSPPGVATTTNRTRGRDWSNRDHRRPPRPGGQEGRHRRREDAARRAQARAARRPRGPGEAASRGPGLSPQPVAASTFCQIPGLADRSGSQRGYLAESGGKARRCPVRRRVRVLPDHSGVRYAPGGFDRPPALPEEQHR
jgi:hypothetical protein